MTSPRRFEADLPVLLADLYLTGKPHYRDDLLRLTARTPQRPAWSFPERWIPMQIATRLAPAAQLPIRRLAGRSIDWRAILAGLLLPGSVPTGSRGPTGDSCTVMQPCRMK